VTGRVEGLPQEFVGKAFHASLVASLVADGNSSE
jgi:hypothetical protein